MRLSQAGDSREGEVNALIDLPIDDARRLKYQAGLKEHREAGTDDFVGDPAVELYMEMLDSINYLDEMARRGVKVPTFIGAAIRSCAQWAREIHQERGQS